MKTVKKTLPKSIIKRIEEINTLIKYAAENDIMAIEYSGTWESVYQFKPIEYKNQFVTIAYYKDYKKKLIKERYNINNIFETVSSQLTWVKRCIEKGIREYKKESLTGNNMKPTAKQLEALSKGREARAKKIAKPAAKKTANKLGKPCGFKKGMAGKLGRPENSPIRKFAYYAYNYEPDFIRKVWAHDKLLADHLVSKFNGYYKQYTDRGVMIAFYVNLDQENQKILENYIIKNYNC